MLSADFGRTLREAQAGDQHAFVRLWREANPMMIRYLRVAGAGDPYDGAARAWAAAIPGMAEFSGDEIAWRAWVLQCARRCAAERAVHRFRGAARVQPGRGRSAEPGTRSDRELDETLAALRELPLGQGEILMLRLGAELPVAVVAELVGTDVVAVRRAEARAVERLGTARDLLAWSLAAPPTSDELRDHHQALRAFAALMRSRPAVSHTRVIAVGMPPRRGGVTSGRSRGVAFLIGLLSASVMSLGGLSVAAYAGMLPAGVQQVMHRLIGAPAAIVKAPSPPPGRRAGGPTQRATRTSGQGSRKTPSGDPTVSLARAVGPTGNPDAAGRGGTPNSHATSKNPHPTRDATPDSVTHDSATHDSATHDSANPAHPTKHVVTTSTTHGGGPGAKDNPTATRHSTGASGSTTLTPHS